jgi:hypothetical protein
VARWATAGCTTSRDLAIFSISLLQVSLSFVATRKVVRLQHLIPVTINITVQRGVTAVIFACSHQHFGAICYGNLHSARNVYQSTFTASRAKRQRSCIRLARDQVHSRNVLKTVANFGLYKWLQMSSADQ